MLHLKTSISAVSPIAPINAGEAVTVVAELAMVVVVTRKPVITEPAPVRLIAPENVLVEMMVVAELATTTAWAEMRSALMVFVLIIFLVAIP